MMSVTHLMDGGAGWAGRYCKGGLTVDGQTKNAGMELRFSKGGYTSVGTSTALFRLVSQEGDQLAWE